MLINRIPTFEAKQHTNVINFNSISRNIHLRNHCFEFFVKFISGEMFAKMFKLKWDGHFESHFGITRGHIHHVDNKLGFDQRLPYETPVQGLYFCSAGCHPAGAVIGAAGYNAAQAVLEAMA